MVITCPSCRRRFNLPLDKVRSRTAKLKCSRCKSLFTQDLAVLVDVKEAKVTPDEMEMLARLPAAAPPAARPVPPPPARSAQPAPARQALQPQPQAAPRASVTRPLAPVAPKAAPPPAPPPPQPAAKPAPKPASPPKPVVPVIAGYESYAEAPAVDEEHQEALARAEEAAQEQAELRKKEEEEARAAAEQAEEAAAQAAVEAALAQATEEAIDSTGPLPEPPPAEEAFGLAATDTLPPDLVAGLDAVAAGGGTGDEPAAVEEPTGEEPLITTGPRREDAADLFRGAQTPSGRFAVAGTTAGAEMDDFLLLSDEETPGPGRWVALGLGILLALLAASFVFVMARNSWKLDTGHLGQQIKYAFWMGPPVVETANCVVTTMRLPGIVKGQDGIAVVVWGLTENICPYSVTGVSISCTLEGPGGPWKDAARPFVERAPSDLSELALAEETLSGMARAISERENSVGVVLANQKHEVWCIFSGAAGTDSKATQFRSSFQVTTP